MRNLLGRLNARTADQLGRIATAWQIHLTATDRLALVAQLYRALTDVRTIRDLWERLPADERAMVALFALDEERALPLPDLAAALDRSLDDARQTATSLYRKGIVAREGDDDELPVGELPRLFLPRELASQFRRVQDEIENGDVTTTPLRALIALLDDREIEDAASIWGIRVIPGLRSRDEIVHQLLTAIVDPTRRDTVLRHLKRDALQLWTHVLEAPGAAAVPLVTAMESADLGGDDARAVTRRRNALAALEDALLVWHSYGPDDLRLLFIPSDIRAPQAPLVTELTPPQPFGQEPSGIVRYEPYTLAWDLLTMLRAIAPPAVVHLEDGGSLSKSVLRRVNAGLWIRGKDVPPVGYAAFLLDLAEKQGLIAGGDPAAGDPLTLTGEMRGWRDRSFTDQAARLRGLWLRSESWIEGEERGDVDVAGADWAGFRLKLIAHLGVLAADGWYALEAVAEWLAKRDPNMLGSTFTAATARTAGLPDDDLNGRQLVIAEVSVMTLETAAHWFGLIERASGGNRERLIRLTPAGAALAHGQAVPEVAESATAAMTAVPDGTLTLLEPTPVRVWSLTAFADLVELGPPATYRLTEDSIGRALAAGFAVTQIGGFLARQLGIPPPADLLAMIDRWGTGFRRVRVQDCLVLTPGDAGQAAELIEIATKAGLTAEGAGGKVLLYASGAEAALAVKAMRDAGYAIQHEGTTLREKRPAT